MAKAPWGSWSRTGSLFFSPRCCRWSGDGGGHETACDGWWRRVARGKGCVSAAGTIFAERQSNVRSAVRFRCPRRTTRRWSGPRRRYSLVAVECRACAAAAAQRPYVIRPRLMDVDRDWLRRSLREQLELLAAPGEHALARLPDGCVKADEL